MFKSLNEWRENRAKLYARLLDSYLFPQTIEYQQQVQKITDATIELQLDKNSTISVIRNIFTDPSQSPEEINIQFLKANLDHIVNVVQEMPAESFATPIGYTEQMINNKCAFEEIALCENVKDLEPIDGLIIEGNIVYIPDTTKLSTVYNKRIIDFLKKNNAKNLANHIKWTRKLSEIK